MAAGKLWPSYWHCKQVLHCKMLHSPFVIASSGGAPPLEVLVKNRIGPFVLVISLNFILFGPLQCALIWGCLLKSMWKLQLMQGVAKLLSVFCEAFHPCYISLTAFQFVSRHNSKCWLLPLNPKQLVTKILKNPHSPHPPMPLWSAFKISWRKLPMHTAFFVVASKIWHVLLIT